MSPIAVSSLAVVCPLAFGLGGSFLRSNDGSVQDFGRIDVGGEAGLHNFQVLVGERVGAIAAGEKLPQVMREIRLVRRGQDQRAGDDHQGIDGGFKRLDFFPVTRRFSWRSSRAVSRNNNKGFKQWE